MPDRDISPVPDSPRPQGSGHYRAEDDIELPPMAEAESAQPETAGWPIQKGDSPKQRSVSSVLGVAALIGALVVGGWFAMRGGSLEKQHANWQHVTAAAEASDGVAHQLVHVDGAGMSQTLQSIEISAADIDRETTRQVRLALMRNDLVTATATLQAAQNMPTASQNSDVRPPQITPDSELATALKDGRNELYQIELFDCCHEDGDIVEILVNGASFATVPITHAGTMLSIPLGRGSNTVTVRGIRDGGGGVTVSFRTSRGDYFARYMRVGEEHQMGVVVQ